MGTFVALWVTERRNEGSTDGRKDEHTYQYIPASGGITNVLGILPIYFTYLRPFDKD